MDDSSNRPPLNRQTDHLGVNKMGKNIKKSPLYQPNFAGAARDQPQPQVYNINKNDFRDIVQQLTGSPMREPLRPAQNSPKPPNNRLQKIRPPPLAPTNRPQIPIHHHLPNPAPAHHHLPNPAPAHPSVPLPHANNFARPPPPAHYGQPSRNAMLPLTPPDVWANTAESPVSAYARYLQNSIIDSGPRQPQSQPQHPPQPQPNMQPQVNSLPHPHPHPHPHLLPNPVMPPLPPPMVNGPNSNFPSPRMNVHSDLLLSPRVNGPQPTLPSPSMNGHSPSLLSPTSQFLLHSPTGFLNLFSPRSPYPLLSPGYQHPPPISPNFSFSSAANSGILGSGPPLPPSPGYGFPLSPSGFFPASSPRWRDQ